MITLETLSSIRGEKASAYFEDDPKQRADLAETVQKLIKDGHSVFIVADQELAHRVLGYDADKNEWLYAAERSKKTGWVKRMAAAATEAVQVPRRAGG